MRPLRRTMRAVLAAIPLSMGCERSAVAPISPPVIQSVSVTPGATNVLSAEVAIVATGADSVAVEVSVIGAGGDPVVTPTVTMKQSAAWVFALGLEADRHYEARVIAFGAGGITRSEPSPFITGPLPPDLPHFVANGSAPLPGYVAFAAGGYGLVIDNSGRVVWYHPFPQGVGLNFMPQPNGRYVALPPSQNPASWIEIAPSGQVTRTMTCGRGLRPRLHDLMALDDGSYWILCDETRTLDLSAIGGMPHARVTGTVVQHISPAGEILFDWSPFSHFDITDADPALLTGDAVNWTHGNSFDLDADGTLIVSFRNLNEITGIDTRTAAVLWRLGGRRNQFALDASSETFAQQHSARMAEGNRLLLLDNVGNPVESRAELWQIDPIAKVARMVKTQGSLPPVVTPIGGSVQSLGEGHTLVSFGVTGRVEEYDASGNVVWRIQSGAGYVFRAQRIQSLYDPGRHLAR